MEIQPASFLLPGPGESVQLEVLAFDADGQAMEPPPASELTWISLDSATIRPDGDGTVSAISSGGSTSILVEWNSITSEPALGLVAQPAGGAVIVADSQVARGMEPVDPTAAYGVGWRYTVRLAAPTPAVGDILIGGGEEPLAGRVVGASEDGAEVEVTLELVPVHDLFDDLVVDERIRLVETEREAAPGPAANAGAEDGFMVGPFTCESSTGSGFDLAGPTYGVESDLSLVFQYDNGLRRMTAEGDITATLAYAPRFGASFQGQVGCELVLHTYVVPVTGVLSLVLATQVPIGIGFALDGSITVAEAGFDGEAEASVGIVLGLDCAGGGECAWINSITPGGADARFELVSPDPSEQFGLTLSAHTFGFARLTVGNPLVEGLDWEILEATLGPKQSLDLASTHRQVADTAYRSGFDLTLAGGSRAGSDLRTAIEYLNELLGTEIDATAELVTIADTLAVSPQGTFTIQPGSIAPGDDEMPGDSATFSVTLDPVTYHGTYAVDAVQIRWMREDGDGGFTLGPGRPGCSEITVTAAGQTRFDCRTDFLPQHIGTQSFYAFVDANVFGASLPVPLEVALDGRADVMVATTGWRNITAGLHQTCATTTAGVGYCWGSNLYGRLGDGTATDRHAPSAVAGGHLWRRVTTGRATNGCGITVGGSGYCWGRNIDGTLGDSTQVDRSTPTRIWGNAAWSALTTGLSHTCGITTAGAGYCWGNSDYVGHGNDTTTTRWFVVPTAVAGGTAWTSMSAGGLHTCGIAANAAAYCWGHGGVAGLGDGTTSDRIAPTLVAGGRAWAAISSGATHTCGITTEQTAYCWGSNFFGQLGDGTATDRRTPVPVAGGHEWLAVDAGASHSCGITTDRTAYCWGFNFTGQLGDGSNTSTDTPIPVSGGHTWAAISAGAFHTCGITTTGVAYCWGENEDGRVGDETTTNRDSPVPVAAPPSARVAGTY